MRKLFSTLFLILVLVFPLQSFAQDQTQKVDIYALFWPVVPGQTVANPMFVLKQLKEGFDGMFKSGEINKSAYQMELAEKRLVEAAKLVEDKDFSNAYKSLQMNSSNRNEAVDLKRKAVEKNQNISELSPKLVQSLEKQQQALTFLSIQFPGDQQDEVNTMVEEITLQISEAK